MWAGAVGEEGEDEVTGEADSVVAGVVVGQGGGVGVTVRGVDACE